MFNRTKVTRLGARLVTLAGACLAANAIGDPAVEAPRKYDAGCRVWSWDGLMYDGRTLDMISSYDCKIPGNPINPACVAQLAIRVHNYRSSFVNALIKLKDADPKKVDPKAPKCVLEGTEGSYAKEAVEQFVRTNLEAQVNKEVALNLQLFLKELSAYDASKQKDLAAEVLKQMQTQPEFDRAVAEAVKRAASAAK